MKKQSENQNGSQKEQSERLEDDQAKEQQENYDRLKTKQLPALIMLLGGAVAVIVTYVRGFSLREILVIVLVSLLGFYILGLILKRIFDSFRIRQKKEEEGSTMEEGEVIEKEPE
ncbi:MAG: hypothetical protein K2I07_10030 [Lachnospiraceae bacterium]|nr:hypothetical protein [Lachnospiraceae bacterium]